MARLGFLLRLLLAVLVGCSTVLFSSAQSPQSPNISDLDRVMNEAVQPGPYGPVYANARGKVKEISKKTITILQPDGTAPGRTGGPYQPYHHNRVPHLRRGFIAPKVGHFRGS